ncbi:MAG: winged helix-turn-helix domain-containing protein [Mesorhizobium sp.]|jgi:uncharacterized protein
MEEISISAARRIALAAQGFADPKPGAAVTRNHLKRVLSRLGLFQIDSVNVIVRAHYMPLFSRLGPYKRELVDEAATGRKRLLFEYWAHEASLLPVETYPLMRWRMEQAAQGKGMWANVAQFAAQRADFIRSVFSEVASRGPISASDFDGERGEGGWWGWSDAKRALEYLFWSGRITAAARRPSFERLYDLPERVLPKSVLAMPTPTPAEAHRELLRIAAHALGVATASDLRDYFRMSPGDADPRIAELVEAGELLPVKVKGWSSKAYLDPKARRPRRVEAKALLAPFDPLVWERSRTERLFDFRYRIEIYTPAAKRVHGYYVLPFLLGERLVGRVCLKADRQASALRVNAAYAEDHAPPETAGALLGELKGMANWLELDRVEIMSSGDLAPALADIGRGTDMAA